MKKYIVFLSFIFTLISWGQDTIEDAWVYFKDKPEADTFLAQPLTMLSQRALDRRQRLQISLDNKDVPVDSTYLNEVYNANGITYKAKSKWLNAVHVQGIEADIRALIDFNFVDHIEFANKNIGVILPPQATEFTPSPIVSNRASFDYGAAAGQIDMLQGALLHQNNYTGQNVLVAIIDAGFQQVNTSAFFQHLYTDQKLIDVYNFVGNDQNVYQYHYHGTEVLSTIAGNSNGIYVGTAPDASVALYVSEDVSQESPLEESYWAEAAERADSIGVDVINTSLGYNVFDRADYNYSLEDLDGQTAFISRAAEIAVSRGINVVVSAGNSGQDASWPKISFPADAAGVITVGAVDNNRVRASFSSTGPTADNRIKPDVMAQGVSAAVYYNDQVLQNSGTSFSSPIIAGMVACMVQALPQKRPAEIKQDLISIADRFQNPDNYYGYGIPDFSKSALNINYQKNKTWIYPNPAKNYVFIKQESGQSIQIFSIDGKLIMDLPNFQSPVNISSLPTGIYYIKTDQFKQPLIIQ